MFRFALLLTLLACCGSEKKPEQMPAASSWGSGTAKDSPMANDPHAGLDMGGAEDPHAGLDMGGMGDPHAGLDMGVANDPHAGLDMGEEEGFVAPDPNRVVDRKMFVSGNISVNAQTESLVQPGAIVFVSVRPANQNGAEAGQTLAVERYEVKSLPLEFHLSGMQSMLAGTKFSGDVEIYARVDGDGEASTALAGDVEGRVKATIPASGLSLVLDSVL